MNKKILVSLGIFSTVLAIGTIIFAFTSKINLANLYPYIETEESSQKIYLNISQDKYSLNKDEEKMLLEKAKSYISCLFGKETRNIDLDKNATIKGHYDNTTEQNFIDISTDEFTISINENKSLRAFSDNTIDYNSITRETSENAERYITELYRNLDISHDYELIYLEKFDDCLWEADFTKKMDDIYNDYDSIKIYFSPEQQKIAAMRVHSTYNTPIVSENTKNEVKKSDVFGILQQNFDNITEKSIINIEKVYTKPNNFFTKKDYGDIISENRIVKAYKVKLTFDNEIFFVFIDINTGNIVGGDQLK